MYTRRTTTKGEFTTGSNATHSNNLVVYSTNIQEIKCGQLKLQMALVVILQWD